MNASTHKTLGDAPQAASNLAAVTARHRGALWRYLRVLGASPADAEDLVQEAFLTALRRPDFDGSSAAGVFTFLRTTARQLWLRSNKRTVDEQQLVEADQIWDRRCGDGPGDDYVEALQRCIAELSPRSQELLRATYTDGEGREVVGAQLGLSLDGVKSALRRLRGWLHNCITSRLEQVEEDR